MHHEQLETVREVVRRVLRARNPEFDPAAINESVLMRGARLAGHQFTTGRYKLRWLIGEQKLWLHEEGQAPRAIDINEPAAAQKAA